MQPGPLSIARLRLLAALLLGGALGCSSTVSFLPEGDLFARPLADIEEPRSAVVFVFDETADSLPSSGVEVHFGETLPCWRFGEEGDDVLVDVGVGFGWRTSFGHPDLDQYGSDGQIGMPVHVRSGGFSARFYPYHRSSHIGDEFAERTGQLRVDYSRIVMEGLLSYEWESGLRLYGGGGYAIQEEEPDAPLQGQAGAELEGPTLGWLGIPVVAVDLQWKEEAEYRTNLSLTAGLRHASSALVRTVDFSFDFATGHSTQSQFFDERSTRWGISVRFDL